MCSNRNTYTSGKDPMGLAATVLYVAGANNGEHMTQGEIATAAGLTSVAAPLETVWSILTDFKMYVLDSLLTYGM